MAPLSAEQRKNIAHIENLPLQLTHIEDNPRAILKLRDAYGLN